MGTSKGYRDLIVYQKAFDVAMRIFKTSSSFPNSEKYSLTDQIRRSSRSVCVCIAEAYRKRRYPAYFVSKLTDADGENSETIVWLEFSTACGILRADLRQQLEELCEEVGRMLNTMIENPDKFLPRGQKPH